jgi:Ca2+/H+ antiporter, TMEM165/GDT1 family
MDAIALPFITILLAELLDKSQLSVLLLATKTKRHLELFLGVLFAFIIVDGAAILFGAFLTTLIPQLYVKVASGLLFILFGILSLRDSSTDEEHAKIKLAQPAITGFLTVFLSEWGDKTQLASAVFASRYDALPVFLGVISALALLSLTAILLSNTLTKHIKPHLVHKTAGIIFLVQKTLSYRALDKILALMV